jgi:hypothetical protein
MSNFGPMPARAAQRGLPLPPKGDPIAVYDTYLDAQRAVDYLSDNHFPVQFVTIVGSDLRMVERVTGRLTYGRVALASGLNGAWFGLFVGLLLQIFGKAPAGTVLAAMLIGAAFAVLAGIISYAASRGRRDFTSTSQIVAREYEVLCLAEHVTDALDLLVRLPGGTGRRPSATALRTDQVPSVQDPAAPDLPPAPVSGPTYGEMIDRQRAERDERERLERARTEREHGGTSGA